MKSSKQNIWKSENLEFTFRPSSQLLRAQSDLVESCPYTNWCCGLFRNMIFKTQFNKSKKRPPSKEEELDGNRAQSKRAVNQQHQHLSISKQFDQEIRSNQIRVCLFVCLFYPCFAWSLLPQHHGQTLVLFSNTFVNIERKITK